MWIAATGARAENTAAVNEVLKLKDAGVDEQTILSFIQGKSINYDLSADNLLALRSKGVTTAVLNAMVSSGQGPSVSAVPPVGVPANAPSEDAASSQVPSAPTAPQAPTVGSSPEYVSPPPMPVPAGTASTPAANPNAAYFYQELSPYGRWVLAEDGQWYWQPSVALTSPAWRPYWDNGHWVYSDSGWYWSSDYPWGWAAFHYGRWELHPHFGWIWLPDRVWGPGWVTWRSGGEYCGWAPLPPGAVFEVATGRFRFHGRAVALDFDFGLGWMNFNFCYVRELGEPMHWHPNGPTEIRAVFDHTKVITGFRAGTSVINGEARGHFINAGVEVKRVEELRGRPVEPVKIQDLQVHVGRDVHERFDPKARTLETYRPRFDHREGRRDRG